MNAFTNKDDYFSGGGIQSDLSILKDNSLRPSKQLSQDYLFLDGYGTRWGERLTLSVGTAYGTGLLCGGSYGLARGLQIGGATPKLLLNRVLNSCTTYGPNIGSQAAIITMFYSGFSRLIQLARDSDDVYNAPIAGFLSGGLFKITTSWKSAAKYSVAAAVLSTGMDYIFRRGYF